MMVYLGLQLLLLSSSLELFSSFVRPTSLSMVHVVQGVRKHL